MEEAESTVYVSTSLPSSLCCDPGLGLELVAWRMTESALDVMNVQCGISFGSDDGELGFVGQSLENSLVKKTVCHECNLTFAKPALLVQHNRAHSEQRPFACPVDGCSSTYKRQDHLNRHLTKHQGKLFWCPHPGCDMACNILSNLQRHLKRHEERPDFSSRKLCKVRLLDCPEFGCGKSFRYPSQLKYHSESCHSAVKYDEVTCCHSGCGLTFESAAVLLKHDKDSHPHCTCDICGVSISRKHLNRHLQTHDPFRERVRCPYIDCQHSYSSKSNLTKHIRTVHLELKPFVCSHEGCGMRFGFKAVRDRHEFTGIHFHTQGDFEAEDNRFKLIPHGGRKRVKLEKVEDLYVRKIQKTGNSQAIQHERS